MLALTKLADELSPDEEAAHEALVEALPTTSSTSVRGLQLGPAGVELASVDEVIEPLLRLELGGSCQ